MEKNVAILVESSRAYGRGLLQGINRYQQEHRVWRTWFQHGGLGDPVPAWLKHWQGDGVLARIETVEMAQLLYQLGVPVVNLRGIVTGYDFPFVGSDNEAVGRLGAEHLISKGLVHFAIVGFDDYLHTGFAQRKQSFIRHLQKSHFDCQEYRSRKGLVSARRWHADQENLAEWIRQLPKPVGILTVNDDLGFQVIDACRRINASIPNEVAILGVENDELVCHFSVPPLSSIDLQSETTGYEAAHLLAQLMAGEVQVQDVRRIPPRAVVARQSTDVIHIADPLIARIIRLIRSDLSITPSDIFKKLNISRTTIAIRMKRALGHTLVDEIQAQRIAMAEDLMISTTLPLKIIATQCGFQNVHYFTKVFRKRTGETPAAWRAARQHPGV